jgi:murein DD-endopeptidase MepM/ murein hydrolase activator NlpD
MMPVAGPITSYFGYRYHPILHFTRFHAGLDIGAGWGSPIVAAADGQVVGAGWGGGYGREVQIAHGGGVTSIYGHMSGIVAQPGSYVRAGQLIGYVGSSGLSTGPHLHFEVRQGGQPVNPLAVRFTSATVVDTRLAEAVKTRLKSLLSVGVKS